MGSPERKQACAASGSHQMLYSAAGVMFPTVQAAPPMTTQRPTRDAMSGASASARATFVRGPRVTRTTPGWARMDATSAGTAWAAAGGRRGGG